MSGERVLVVGATSDIAQEVAKIYASRKGKIFLVGRDAVRLEVVAKDLTARGADAVGICVADLTHLETCARAAQEAQAFLGDVQVAIMAQGVMGVQEVLTRDPLAMEALFRVNVLSFIALTSGLKDHMKSGATLAMISSVAGDRGRQSNYVYAASKAALTAVASGMRQEMFASGINVLTIKPGFVSTKMTAHMKQGALFASPRKVASDIVAAIDKRKASIYTPFFWWGIMTIIKSIPEKIFRKLKL